MSIGDLDRNVISALAGAHRVILFVYLLLIRMRKSFSDMVECFQWQSSSVMLLWLGGWGGTHGGPQCSRADGCTGCTYRSFIIKFCHRVQVGALDDYYFSF